MDQVLMDQIHNDYASVEVQEVLNQLLSIDLKHVMGQSEYNLNNTHYSILYLADGDLEKLKELVIAAKRDFRDVVSWAIEMKKKEK